MFAILIAAGSCDGQRPKVPAARTGEQIVQSMVAAYQRATSYEDQGVVDRVFSGASTHTRHAEFDTAFTRAGGFRHEVRDERGASPVITWMTEGRLRRYAPGGTIEPTAALGGPGFYSAVPRMLLPTAARNHGMSDFKHTHVVGTGEVIDGNLCWRVVALRASGGELTLWIDQATYLLRRTVAREYFPAGIEGDAFQSETTTRYRPVVNVEIAASRLAGPAPTRIPPPRSEPWIGVEVAANAAQVVRVLGGTPAERAGLQPGDALVSVDGLTIPDSDALFKVVRQKGVGATVALVIRRGGSSRVNGGGSPS